jgi:hypothetical protein
MSGVELGSFMRCRPTIEKLKSSGTAIAATAWIAVGAYLCLVAPSLAALVETLDAVPPAIDRLVHVPRAAFLALGIVAALGLTLKDRWLRAPLALAIDALIGAPALISIGYLVHPFFVPVE